jgi:hypothetical protein
MTTKFEIEGLLCMNRKKQEARGNARNKDAKKTNE